MLLKEITLQTKNISALYHFYKEVLELNVQQLNKTSILIRAGTTSLVFQNTNDNVNPLYHFAFNIPSNKIEEALQWLKERVDLIMIEEYKNCIAEFKSWNARSVYFTDAAGNILEFIARVELNDNPEEVFSSKQIRNVSELGIVFPVDEFDTKVEDLLQKFQLRYFDKQPPLKYFRAIGDDDGLLIVVPEHRNWYPTNTASGIFSFKLKFENDEREYELNY